jgi:hypothetical protein
VIAADQAFDFTAAFFNERGAAMATGIVERAYRAIFAANDDDGRAGALKEIKAARLRDFIRMTGIEPGLLPQLSLLEIEERRIGIATPGN